MRIALVLLGVLMIRTGGLGFGRFLNQTPNSGFGRATSPLSLILVHTSVFYLFVAYHTAVMVELTQEQIKEAIE